MGISIWHLLILFFIILLIFGPGRISGLGKSLGETLRSFKKGLDQDEIDVTPPSKRRKGEDDGGGED